MNTITVAGKSIEVDEEGFLNDRSEWTEEVAAAMARADGVEMTPAHWEVINFMREYFEEYQCTPNGRMLPKAIGKWLGPEKGNNKYLYELFPYGPAKPAYRGTPACRASGARSDLLSPPFSPTANQKGAYA